MKAMFHSTLLVTQHQSSKRKVEGKQNSEASVLDKASEGSEILVRRVEKVDNGL
jgi:hypothetical protein